MGLDELSLKSEVVRKTVQIEYELYEELKYLSDNVYDASINKLVISCIKEIFDKDEFLIKPQKVNNLKIARSLTMKESDLIKLEHLRDRYGISINKLINIAIRDNISKLKEKANISKEIIK